MALKVSPIFWCLALVLLPAYPVLGQQKTAPDRHEMATLFESKIRPLLIRNCLSCHGDKAQQGGLRLDSRAAIGKGGARGPAINSTLSDESLLLTAVRQTGALKMPPAGKLRQDEIESLALWVKQGAYWPPETQADKIVSATDRKFWSFEPVKKPALPGVSNLTWCKTPIDRFILAKLETAQLSPAKPADRRTLIRRATYDLTGLPPAPAEVEAFVNDGSPDAFAKLVDRLLQSPRYGEQWGRHWLDIVRYADTAGENSDHPLPHAWRYRNWVIQAFNSNKPYDEFIREQIAGDLIATSGPPEKYADRIIATGYLAMARRFGHDIDQDMYLTYEDTIDNLGKAVLGLSIGCARCHDHKFDPITAKDYYGFYGIFASTKYSFPGCEPKQMPRDLVSLAPPNAAPALRSAGQVAYAVSEGTPGDVQIQKRGDPTQPGDPAPRKFLDILGGQKLTSPQASGRLELAGWLTAPANPLTARVIVNRVWQWHFGRGLVRTPNDFGTRGAMPTHPELLDYLATEFMRSGWDIKALHRLIMLSSVYQRASAPVPAQALDLYAAFARRPLSAEELRDTLLTASGELDLEPGQAHPFPPESSWSFSQHAPFAAEYPTNKRSIYVMQKRNRRSRFLALFDGPDPNASTAVRDATLVPTQALYFMNDPFVHACAAKFAQRMIAAGTTDRQRLDTAFLTLYGRHPSEAEQRDAAEFLLQYRSGVTAAEIAGAWNAYARVLLTGNEFYFID
jgi:mono/diheme cytochrome c family protein